MRIVFLKTATSGLPNWKMPSDDESQSVIVELAYQVWKDGQLVTEVEQILNNQMPIPAKTVALHGLDEARCATDGVSPIGPIMDVIAAIDHADLLVGHNVSFDIRMLRIMAARWLGISWENQTKVYDVMQEAAEHCQIPKSGRGQGRWKNPTLEESYLHFFGVAMNRTYRAGPGCERARMIYEKLNPALI